MAAEHHHSTPPSIVVHDDHPLLGVLETEDGHEVTRYFTEHGSLPGDPSAAIEAALAAVGAWSDLDWDEVEAALDRIRHESRPAPPIEL